jgi:hypothetical protein
MPALKYKINDASAWHGISDTPGLLSVYLFWKKYPCLSLISFS